MESTRCAMPGLSNAPRSSSCARFGGAAVRVLLCSLGPVQTERFEAKTKPNNKSEDEIGRCTPSNWSNYEKEAQETGWARFRF